MSLSKEPAELEARLLQALECLRKIATALDAVLTQPINPNAVAGVAVLCSLHAATTVAEITL